MGDAYAMGEKLNRDGTHTISPIGVLGDPRGATAEAGKEYFNSLATLLSTYVMQRREEWTPGLPGNLPYGGLSEPEGDLAERNEGIFTPPGVNGSVLYPSDSGGSNWGGVAYDPESGLAVVNSTNILRSQKLVPRKEFEASGDSHNKAGRSIALMPGTPFVWTRETLTSGFGIPCNPPPWGNLTAIDTSTGKIHWQIPFGRKPLGFGFFHTPQNWGSPNQGGPIITKGGLIFIGASLDNRIRAYDLYSGEELWSAELPAPGNATPMTYLHSESKRQFIVIAAGGYPTFKTELSDAIVAFTLPE